MRQSEYKGKTVILKEIDHPDFGKITGLKYKVEDYWETVSGKSWMISDGNPACLLYAIRSAVAKLPTDNNVLYGKIRGVGVLIHVSEIDKTTEK